MYGIKEWSEPAKYVIHLQEEKKKWKLRAQVLLATNILMGIALVAVLIAWAS